MRKKSHCHSSRRVLPQRTRRRRRRAKRKVLRKVLLSLGSLSPDIITLKFLLPADNSCRLFTGASFNALFNDECTPKSSLSYELPRQCTYIYILTLILFFCCSASLSLHPCCCSAVHLYIPRERIAIPLVKL